MNEKQFYTSPEVELLVVRFEEGFLKVSGKGNTIGNGTIDDWDVDL